MNKPPIKKTIIIKKHIQNIAHASKVLHKKYMSNLHHSIKQKEKKRL